MNSFLVRFYTTPSGVLEIVVQAKNRGEAEKIIRATYASTFKAIASVKELR